MRFVAFAGALALCACAPPPPPAQTASAQWPPCSAAQDSADPTTPFAAHECKLEAAGQIFHVAFAAVPAGGTGGEVTVESISSTGSVSQRLTENNVSEYLNPTIEDVDGDGRVDVLIARDTGNVNTNYAVWRNVDGRFARLGEVSGVEFKRTADGLLAVPARSSAASWVVAFYRIDPDTLVPLVTIDVTADQTDDQGHIVHSTCTVEEAPGLPTLRLTEAAAEAKFCAEPAAKVFD